MDTISTYEIFFKSGNTVVLNHVNSLSIELNNGTIVSLNISGSEKWDKIIHINLSDITCIVKRDEYPKLDRRRKWWKLWNY